MRAGWRQGSLLCCLLQQCVFASAMLAECRATAPPSRPCDGMPRRRAHPQVADRLDAAIWVVLVGGLAHVVAAKGGGQARGRGKDVGRGRQGSRMRGRSWAAVEHGVVQGLLARGRSAAHSGSASPRVVRRLSTQPQSALLAAAHATAETMPVPQRSKVATEKPESVVSLPA